MKRAAQLLIAIGILATFATPAAQAVATPATPYPIYACTVNPDYPRSATQDQERGYTDVVCSVGFTVLNVRSTLYWTTCPSHNGTTCALNVMSNGLGFNPTTASCRGCSGVDADAEAGKPSGCRYYWTRGQGWGNYPGGTLGLTTAWASDLDLHCH